MPKYENTSAMVGAILFGGWRVVTAIACNPVELFFRGLRFLAIILGRFLSSRRCFACIFKRYTKRFDSRFASGRDMLLVFWRSRCWRQYWFGMEHACVFFWGVAVSICSTWSTFLSVGISMGQIQRMFARKYPRWKGGALVAGGCHVASLAGMAHQNGRAKAEQQLMNLFFWHFERFNFYRQWTCHGFSRWHSKRGPFTLLHHMRCVGDEGDALRFDMVLSGWAWAGSMVWSVFPSFATEFAWFLGTLEVSPSVNHFEVGGGLKWNPVTRNHFFLAGDVSLAWVTVLKVSMPGCFRAPGPKRSFCFFQ